MTDRIETRILGPGGDDVKYQGKTIQQACEAYAHHYFHRQVMETEVDVYAVRQTERGTRRHGPIKIVKVTSYKVTLLCRAATLDTPSEKP